MRRTPRGVFRAALLCASALCLPHVALAQETGSLLRGEVSETAVNGELLGKATALDGQTTGATQSDQGISAEPYQPASEGATPDQDAGPDSSAKPKSIFADGQGGAQTSSDSTPAVPLSTAQAREEARKKLNAPQQSASQRLAAAHKKRAAGQADESKEETDTVETTGSVRAPTIDSENELRTEAEQQRVQAVEGLRKKPEDNPYAPVGIRVGTFVVSPSVESGLTWTSNADSSTTGEPALLSETTLRLNAISEWGGDKTTFDAFGNFRKTISGEEIKETRAGLDAALERDLGHEWRLLAALGYEIGPESASSPVIIEGTLEEPIVQTYSGSLGAEKDIGKVQLRLTGNVEREIFGDAELSTGGTVSQADRNSTLAALVLRTGYEISPALTPFVELEYGRRFYDEELDSNGFARSTTRTGARAGVALDLGEKFNGELAAGWIREDPEDDRLEPLSGPSLAAALNWSPVRGTLVGLNATTTVEGTTTPDESGSILHSGLLTASRELRANLTGSVALGAAYRDYTGADGHDVIWSTESSLTYWFNRYAGLTGRLRHEQQTSTLPDRDYTANGVFLGLKLQR
jgi:hypothetical protein